VPYFNFSNTSLILFPVIVAAVFVSVCLLKKRWQKRPGGKKENIWLLIFILYFVGLMYVSFYPNPARETQAEQFSSVTPFVGIYYAFKYHITHTMLQYFLNILLYIPFGILVPIIFKKVFNYGRMIVRAGIFIVVVECLQWILPFSNRIFDMEDILCNMLGVIVGFSIYILFKKVLSEKQYKFLLVCAPIIAAFVIFIVDPVVSDPPYRVRMFGSSMFSAKEYTFVGDAVEYPDRAVIYKNGVPYKEIKPVALEDAVKRCQYEVIILLYTEGIDHPDKIEIHSAVLTTSQSFDESYLVPAWSFEGKVYKGNTIRNMRMEVPAY